MPPASPIDTLDGLLASLELSCPQLVASSSFDAVVGHSSSRPSLLAHLKACGVDAIADRQKIANGLQRAQREGRAPRPAAAPAAEGTGSTPASDSARPRPPPPPPPLPPLPPGGRKRRILCLHGGASSGPIMQVQCARFVQHMEAQYDFVFANGPAEQPLDPSAPMAKLLDTFFGGLPVLRWMEISRRDGVVFKYGAEEKAQRGADPAQNGGGGGGDAAADDAERLLERSKGQAANLFVNGQLDGSTHMYTHAGEALRHLGAFVRQEVRAHGRFDGFFGFSQGANLMLIWLALVEAGVLDGAWAAPRWACACCATQWRWAELQFDGAAAELADELRAGLPADAGVRSVDELLAEGGAGGGGVSARLTSGRLITAAPLGIPSLHLHGAKDAALELRSVGVLLTMLNAPSRRISQDSHIFRCMAEIKIKALPVRSSAGEHGTPDTSLTFAVLACRLFGWIDLQLKK